MLLRDIRLATASGPVSLRAVEGAITEIAPGLRPHADEEVHDAGGALAIPGLWDHHVHVGQTAQGYARLGTAGLATVDEVLRTVERALGERTVELGDSRRRDALVGFGHRLVDMAGEPTVAALDAVGGDVTPIVLIGGDAHHAWMSSAALRGLGLPPRRGIVAEDEWFDAVAHLDDLPGVAASLESGIVQLQADALSRGVVGLTDMEWGPNWELWRRRPVRMRVRTATYVSTLDRIPGPTGTVVDSTGLVTMGPLKVIADGSLGSRSAYCRHPYAFSGDANGMHGTHGVHGTHGTQVTQGADHAGYGVLSEYADQLDALLSRAQELGLEAAVHAIGDAAAQVGLDAFAARGMRGRIEHAQLLEDVDVARMSALGMTASIQPAHLLDDRDPTTEVWPDLARLCYRFRDLADAGVPLLMGSDSPVAPVDPWLAMSAAVHRSADDRDAWFPLQQLQPREALAASTDGIAELAVGGPADIVLLDDPHDDRAEDHAGNRTENHAENRTGNRAGASSLFADVPLDADGVMIEGAAREAAARLREASVLATFVAGRVAAQR